MQGISVYVRENRPTYYVAYDCPVRGRRVCESSGIKLDDHRGKLAAYAYAREKSLSGVMHGASRDQSQWRNWVEPFLRMRYANPAQARTLQSYLGAWKFLSLYLQVHKIATPRAFGFEETLGFVAWRESQPKRYGKKCGRNTALHNLKIMSRIMREAIRRGYATVNHCLRITDSAPKAPVPEKPEYTDDQVAKARAAMTDRWAWGEPWDWMPIAFEIALLQTCRLSATQIPMERIDFVRETIEFHEKGDKRFTVPMHPDLKPLLVRLRDEGRKVTLKLPFHASRQFGKVMRRIGLEHTFHCTRVTGITRWARDGVPIQQSMAAVSHGSWGVHKIYQRLKAADVRGVHASLRFSSSAGVPASGPGQSSDARPTRPKPSLASKAGQRKSVPPNPPLQATG